LSEAVGTIRDVAFDSTSLALRIQRELWRGLGPAGRLRVAAQVSDDVRSIALAGLAARHGTLGAGRVTDDLIRLLYGVEPATRPRPRR